MPGKGTAGLGKESVLALARHQPAHIFFTGRNAKAADTVISTVKSAARPTPDAAARAFLEQSSRLDILLCNAGIMATPGGLTTDGYEVQFGTNYVGHALLVKLLVPTLLRTASEVPGAGRARRGCDVAGLHSRARGRDSVRGAEDALRLGHGHRVAALRPEQAGQRAARGRAGAPVPRHPSPPRCTGALSTRTSTGASASSTSCSSCWAATVARDCISSGSFYEPVGIREKTKTEYSTSEKLAKDLSEWTEKELAGYEL
ncbi:MAG: hypothetical protein LQ340_001480 [Diploschistes diacapsis]|nr:MAG: hypothetical protein LQ340_001480 [Diploschistes diacapsis]